MTREQHLRRVVLLCCHFARNFAYYRAGWDGKTLRRGSDFWKTVNGNSIDICVLEWCKLFGEPRGEHHWTKVATDPVPFEAGLYSAVGMSADDFEQYRLKCRTYRDKFIAHLDLEMTAFLPHLDPAWASVRYLHASVVNQEADHRIFVNLPFYLDDYQARHSAEAVKIYEG